MTDPTVEEIMKKNEARSELKNTKFRRELRRLNFEDIYNPMKVYAYLRFGMNIPRPRAKELARWYEDVFYKVVLRESDNEKTKNRLENSL